MGIVINQNQTNQKPTFVSRQWLETENEPEEFFSRLKEAGYAIGQGDKAKFVILDRRNGKVESLLTHLPGVKLAEVENRIDHEKLLSVPELMGLEGKEVEQKREEFREKLEEKGKEAFL